MAYPSTTQFFAELHTLIYKYKDLCSPFEMVGALQYKAIEVQQVSEAALVPLESTPQTPS